MTKIEQLTLALVQLVEESEVVVQTLLDDPDDTTELTDLIKAIETAKKALSA